MQTMTLSHNKYMIIDYKPNQCQPVSPTHDTGDMDTVDMYMVDMDMADMDMADMDIVVLGNRSIGPSLGLTCQVHLV